MGKVQSVIEKYHPDKALADCGINLSSDNSVSLQASDKTQAQTSLERFSVRQGPREPEARSSAEKTKEEEPQKNSNLMFLIKRGSPSKQHPSPPSSSAALNTKGKFKCVCKFSFFIVHFISFVKFSLTLHVLFVFRVFIDLAVH